MYLMDSIAVLEISTESKEPLRFLEFRKKGR
jgi:hypothetical protein